MTAEHGLRIEVACRSALVPLLLLVAPALCLAQSTKPAAPIPVPSDRQVEQALRRGADYLAVQALQAGAIDTRYKEQFPGGAESLVALAQLACGQKPDSPALKPLIEAVLKAKSQTLYARAVQTVLAARLGAKESGDLLTDNVAWLVKQQGLTGGWGYGPGHPTMAQQPRWSDNSNSQLALLALSEAADAGAKVPATVWKNALNYWVRGQNPDGGWGYEPPGGMAAPLRKSSYGSMTASGMASLLLLEQRLSAVEPSAVKGIDVAFAKAAGWLEGHYSAANMPQWTWGASDIYNDYYFVFLHSLARTGELTGWRTIDKNVWWSDLAGSLVARQHIDGAWASPDPAATLDDKDLAVRTSFALLALASVRQAPLINKLHVEAGNDYDACNLTAYVRRTLHWPVGWQRLSATDLTAVGEAPILYIAGPAEVWAKDSPKITPEFAARVRKFVLEGGVLLAGGPDEKATQAAASVLQALLPEFKAAPLPEDHPVFTLRQPIPKDKRPKITGLTDSIRTAVFILDQDLSGAWHANQQTEQPQAFDLAANLALYATDQTCPSGRFDRLRARTLEALPTVNSVRAARVRLEGEPPLCPQALSLLGRMLAGSCSLGIRELPDNNLRADLPDDLRLLWIAGTESSALHDDEARRLQQFVENGGTVFVDAAGRKESFDAWGNVLAKVFGKNAVKPVTADDPFVAGKFHDAATDLSKVTYSPAVASEQPDLKQPVLQGVYVKDKLGAIVSLYAVTCPMSDMPVYGLKSYTRPDAKRLAANVALYAAWKSAKP